jgi:DNA-binding MarR family transcriptional regulator
VEFQTDPLPRPRQLLRWPTYVLGQLSRTAATRLDVALSQEGLSLRTHQILGCLVEFGQVSQQQVCDAIAVDRSDMVRLLDQLEDLGQVVRDRDPADRRRHLLTLTPTGRSALARGERVIARVTDEVLSNLSGAERRTLHRLALRALGEPPDLAMDASSGREASHPGGSSR